MSQQLAPPLVDGDLHPDVNADGAGIGVQDAANLYDGLYAGPDPAQFERMPALKRSGWLAWRALLIDQRPYLAVARSRRSFSIGFIALLFILAIFLLARLIGLGIGLFTSPQLGSLQEILRNFIVGLPWYTDQTRLDPEFARQFALSYGLSWDGVRAALGIPTPTSTTASIATTVLSTLLSWLGFATLAFWMARWFRGVGSWKQTAGTVALSYAPLMLFVFEIVPGAAVPLALVFMLMLVGKYLALKSAHGLTPGYTLAATLLPYLIGLVLLVGVGLFGAAYGLEQIPYFDTAVQTMRSLGPVWQFAPR